MLWNNLASLYILPDLRHYLRGHLGKLAMLVAEQNAFISFGTSGDGWHGLKSNYLKIIGLHRTNTKKNSHLLRD